MLADCYREASRRVRAGDTRNPLRVLSESLAIAEHQRLLSVLLENRLAKHLGFEGNMDWDAHASRDQVLQLLDLAAKAAERLEDHGFPLIFEEADYALSAIT